MLIQLEIPEEISTYYHPPQQLQQIVYEDFIAQEFQKGHISLGQGAQLLGLTYEQFMIEFLGKRRTSFINGTPEELAAEGLREQAWLEEFLRRANNT